MARTYDELVTLVRNWSNRDIEVLPDAIIQDGLRWAADKAYRKLRIPPLEHTVTYDAESLMAATSNVNNRFSSITEIQVPVDLIEFIQIREIDEGGRTTRLFNEKADVRTFNDQYAEKYNDFAFWTRQGNCVLLSPGFGNSATSFSGGTGPSAGLELYYYRRLPALNARYDVTVGNAEAGFLTVAPQDTSDLPAGITQDDIVTIYTNVAVETTGVPRTYSLTMNEANTIPVNVYGGFVPNWLREENERVLLMGALAEVFFYLQENDEAQKYAALFTQEIQELNDEDNMRDASGGNVQVNFNGRGLI